MGYDEKLLYVCKKCGYSTYSYEEHENHAVDNIGHGGSICKPEKTPIYETRTKYESQWVVDEKAWTETIVTGYKCSVCGATK